MNSCDHIGDEGILQFEIKHKKGRTPTFICKLCNNEFNQLEASAIIEGLL